MNSIAIALKHKDYTVSVDKEGDKDQYVNCGKSKGLTEEDTVSSQQKNNEGPTSNELELHINLWKMRSGRLQWNIKYYMDFGIMTSLESNLILIYVPFPLDSKEKWKDLGEIICTDNDLLCTIFNEEIKATPNQKNKCFYEVSSNSYISEEVEKFRPFLFYTLDKESLTIQEDKETKGSWIQISIPSQTLDSNLDRYYIRFRLNIEDITAIAFQSGISNDLIQAAFSKLDMYDLRFNDHRNLGKKVKEKIQKEYYNYPSFSKAHIFYVSNPKTSVENGSLTKCDSRIIEPEVWKDYQPSKYYDKCQIGHHWKFKNKSKDKKLLKDILTNIAKEDSPIDTQVLTESIDKCKQLSSINLFFTAKYPKIGYFTLIVYFAIIVLLGSVGSWLADFLPGDNVQVVGWEWNLKTVLLVVFGALICFHWCYKHINLPKGFGLKFD